MTIEAADLLPSLVPEGISSPMSEASLREPLMLEPAGGCLCAGQEAEPLAVGTDFDQHTSAETFLAVRCDRCGLVYLDPRPATAELSRIHPLTYYLARSGPTASLADWIERRVWARRLRAWCSTLPEGARLLEVGCGNGYHLRVLRTLPRRDWRLEGVEPIQSAVGIARAAGLVVHAGRLQDLQMPAESYDAVLLIDALEHVEDPVGVLQAVGRLLRPEGLVLVIAANARSAAATVFRGRHWTGYDFPRHRNIFDAKTLRRLAQSAGLRVSSLRSASAPYSWVGSVRNALEDWGAPPWLRRLFGRGSLPALALAALVEALAQLRGKGGLLIATLRRARLGG